MKVRKTWLSNNFNPTSMFNSNHIHSFWVIPGIEEIDIPDNWVVMLNQKGEISDRGRFMHLTRIGWDAVKSEVQKLWNKFPIESWQETEHMVLKSISKMEKNFKEEQQRLSVRINSIDKYLQQNEPLKPVDAKD